MFTPLDIELFMLVSFVIASSIILYFILNHGKPYAIFFYNCFLKPFSGKVTSVKQQDSLESFYKGQAAIYDATRGQLLRGREEMLALAAAQLKLRVQKKKEAESTEGRVWVDIGGGTGYNIELLNKFLPVQQFFEKVYLVDLSPSLCEQARQRFRRLGWKNVEVLCMDARGFNLEDRKVDWISMSYSLSMIPDFYSVVDSLSILLSPTGLISVADFYVQSSTTFSERTFTGGAWDRHVNWFSRQFWRIWFEFDRVNLDEGRRDYMEYKFGTLLNVNGRNRLLGGIPYYVWIGCQKLHSAADVLDRVDAAATESPYLAAINSLSSTHSSKTSAETALQLRSKGFEAAVLNLAANLPLPSFFYQIHHWRLYYDELLEKHTQFNNSYIYAFTWEDPRVDHRILKINRDDVILAITSAGDNILSYIIDGAPKRVHAVDLNPTQNHLLELKLAAFSSSLDYKDLWKLFGEGHHEKFSTILMENLSPHLSSRAFQYWWDNRAVFSKSIGLYETGQSRLAIKAARWLFRCCGVAGSVKRMCEARTMNEQREIWQGEVRPVMLSRWVSKFIIGNEQFLWRALGVPPNQRDMIREDHEGGDHAQAMWDYVVNTLDPVVDQGLLGEDNYFYLLCLKGFYTKRCHPSYLTEKGHAKLSKPHAFDGVRIHTDEIKEVLGRLQSETLTIAVIMDSMDWFDTDGIEARRQIKALNNSMKLGGRVLLRSAGLRPWYIRVFEEEGFKAKQVMARHPGAYIDRVNMYASTWVCTKLERVSSGRRESSSSEVDMLEI
ncbi:hypothetical protein P167DRAFT_575618 [Morchella conica CCBAS932]|uniref:Methyltransferase domain-containing protein n=2 Tax=Morchella sect. Distantes TaxID=1051054 RepID=A0A3N4KNQ2_9PEZI|nr:hypothetical protein P167DRAFT_575618 [Morchella conica CCBAS932]